MAQARDAAGVKEIAANLWHKDANVQSDCLKVLYEIGYLDPSLIARYVADFLNLLRSKNNRLVWGSMIALSTIAEVKAAEIYAHREDIKRVMAEGSVITVDNGVKTLALAAARSDERRKEILPYLLHHLATCRPKDVPQHAESTLVAVDASSKQAFIDVLSNRLTGTQAARVKKVIKEAEKRQVTMLIPV